MNSHLCLLLVISLFVTSICATPDDLVVSVKQGKLKGHYLKTRGGRDFLAFQGIPYAKPPLGELRFKRLEPAEPWTGVRNATIEGSSCIQKNLYFNEQDVSGSEDCLFINVYTPKLKNDEPLPVMFWIHGGGWFTGSSTSLMYGPNYLLDKDVILVSFNYRLGPLGFLSTGDSVCPGNNGLKDQVFALEWVRDNIAQFGGNPGRVTIFGQSAGGASVHYHTLSPLSKGLFHGAIAQSGTALSPWASMSVGESKGLALKLGSILDCPTTTSSDLIDCLRTKDAKDIIDTDSHFREWFSYPIIPFRPVVEADEGFIVDESIERIQHGANVENVPFMAGFTSGEGAICAGSLVTNPQIMKEFNEEFEKLAPLVMMYRETSPDPDYVTRRIREYYFQDHPISNETRYAIIDMFTDSFFTLSVDETVRLQAAANTAPVFYYYFDFMPQLSYSRIFGDPSDTDYGVCHCDELQFLFPHDKLFPDAKLGDNDFKMIETLTTLWTEFARTGNPTPSGHQLAHWNPVKTSDVEYLHIGKDAEISMHHGLLAQRVHFWASLPLTNHPYTSIRDEL